MWKRKTTRNLTTVLASDIEKNFFTSNLGRKLIPGSLLAVFTTAPLPGS